MSGKAFAAVPGLGPMRGSHAKSARNSIGKKRRGFRVCVRTLHLVPQGRLKVAQDLVLGSDKQAGQSREGRLNTGAEFSAVPCGTARSRVPNPGLRPGLLSDVPAGLSAQFSRRLLKHGGRISPLFHEDDQISPLFHEGDQISPLFHEGAQNFELIILPQWVTCFLAAEARPTSGSSFWR